MPQVNIDERINADFLAKEAGFGIAWGSMPPSAGARPISFMADRLVAFEAALENYPTAYLAKLKSDKLEELANVRRTKEIIGPSNLVLDDKTVMRLTAAATGLLIDSERESVRWEMSRGVFVELPRNTVLGLAVQAVNHVQACFDVVYDKTQEINAIEISEEVDIFEAENLLNAIDLTTGWPGDPEPE